MEIAHHLQGGLQRIVDGIFAIVPRPVPSLAALQQCKIVSHRGEHDNRGVRENTLPAFDAVSRCGVWGIEFDIRWTKDLVPVVVHDADCRRVFGEPLVIAETNQKELRARIPQIPTLEEVILRYGGKQHLMVELKQQDIIDAEFQQACLQRLFADLSPLRDYHFLTLTPDIFDLVCFVPDSALIVVAELNIKSLSQQAMRKNYGGVSGHYLLISRKMIGRHDKTGTGFVRSRYCFYRELGRDVDWIFTNHAIKLCNIQRQLLKRHGSIDY